MAELLGKHSWAIVLNLQNLKSSLNQWITKLTKSQQKLPKIAPKIKYRSILCLLNHRPQLLYNLIRLKDQKDLFLFQECQHLIVCLFLDKQHLYTNFLIPRLDIQGPYLITLDLETPRVHMTKVKDFPQVITIMDQMHPLKIAFQLLLHVTANLIKKTPSL